MFYPHICVAHTAPHIRSVSLHHEHRSPFLPPPSSAPFSRYAVGDSRSIQHITVACFLRAYKFPTPASSRFTCSMHTALCFSTRACVAYRNSLDTQHCLNVYMSVCRPASRMSSWPVVFSLFFAAPDRLSSRIRPYPMRPCSVHDWPRRARTSVDTGDVVRGIAPTRYVPSSMSAW